MNFRKIFNSKITLCVILLLLGYLGFCLTKAVIEKQQMDVRLASLKKELAIMEQQKADNEKMKDYFASEEFLQKEARRLLSYQKPGEEVVAVIPKKEGTTTQAIQELDNKELGNKIVEKSSNFQKWLQYFFNKR